MLSINLQSKVDGFVCAVECFYSMSIDILTSFRTRPPVNTISKALSVLVTV